MHPCCHLDDITVPKSSVSVTLYLSFFKDFICLFDRERESSCWQSGRQRKIERQAYYPAVSPMQVLIPGPWDHDLSQMQLLN